jgi:hypothetical protein
MAAAMRSRFASEPVQGSWPWPRAVIAARQRMVTVGAQVGWQ